MTELSKCIYNEVIKTHLKRIHWQNKKVSKFKVDGINSKDLSPIITDINFLKSLEVGAEFMFLNDAEKNVVVEEVSSWVHDQLKPKVKGHNFKKVAIHYDRMVPCLDLESDGEYIMLDANGWISNIKYKAWREIAPKAEIDILMENKLLGVLRYQPYSLEKYKICKDLEDSTYYEINTCVQPDWRYDVDNSNDDRIDSRFVNFFDSLFSNNESRQFAIDWIYESIYGRNGTYLVLCGRKGIGKNVLAEALSYMVGVRNYTEAPRSALTKEFNSYLKDKRLVLMDEISFRENREKDKLKSYLNNFQAIEGKGKDARMIELYCSIILSSNNAKDMNIEPDDRRFSVMDLTDVPLRDSIGDEEIEKLLEYIKTKEFPLAFNKWLEENRSEDFIPSRPYKGPTFNELCITTLTTWQIAIYDAITSREKESYKISDLMDLDNRRFFPKRHKDYQTFLENFTVDGKQIGFYDRGTNVNDSQIVPNEEYSPIKIDDLD